MLDIKFVRENPEVVKQNIRNKFQDQSEAREIKYWNWIKKNREIKQEVEALRAERNKTSKQIGALMGQGKREEAEEVKKQVAASGAQITSFLQEKEVEEELLKNMMVIPNIIDPSVPIGKDDSENVEAREVCRARLCCILRFLIIQKSPKILTALIWTAPEELLEMVSII